MRTHKRLPGARVTKRQLKRDRFVDTVFDWALWSRENARTVAVIGGALVVVVGGLLLYRTSRAGESRRAAERYQEVWQAYAAGNYQLAANDFRQFRNQYAGSDYVDEATAYLGDSYYQAGDYPAAIEVLKGFDDDHGDSPLVFAAASVLAAAYEASGDWVNAAAAYRKAQELARYDYQRADALLNEARVLEAGGEPERAADAYRRVVGLDPESPRVAEARVKLAEMIAEPLGGVARPTPAADSAAVSETEAAPTGPGQQIPAASGSGDPGGLPVPTSAPRPDSQR